MKTSDAGIALVKQLEGVRLNAYKDSVGIPTIGVGHIKGVKMGDTITMEQVDELLREDLEIAEQAVNRWVKVPLTQDQFDALVSWTFNLGVGALTNSTMLKMLNKGNYQAAADQMMRWSMAGGKVVLGLVKRRTVERALFLSGLPAPGARS